MNVKTAVSSFLLLIAPACYGQYQCASGQAANSFAANIGQSCVAFSTPTGQEIVALSQSAGLTSQTICDTSSTCPAGFYVLQVSIEPVSLGTLVSAINTAVTYTTDVRTYTNMQLGNSLSLVSSTPGAYFWTFYHAANTAVTVNTTAIALTGSPSYNFRARINLIGNN